MNSDIPEGDLVFKEPIIQINGVTLNIAQAMAVRVAIGSFIFDLQDEEYLKEMGKVGEIYQLRLNEIVKLFK